MAAFRKILLRGMLGSLGAAAVSGVLAVLLQGGDLAGQVIFTSIVAAVACGIMLSVCGMLDHDKTRIGGMLIAVAVTLEFIIALLLIWEVPRVALGVRLSRQLGATMGIVALTAGAYVILIRMTFATSTRLAGWVGMGWAIAAFVAFMSAAWVKPTPPSAMGKLAETGAALLLFGFLMVIALSGIEAGDRRHWRWTGAFAGFVACTLWIMQVWSGAGSDFGSIMFAVLTSVAAVVGHANLCMMFRPGQGQQWIRNVTMISAVVTAIAIDMTVVVEIRAPSLPTLPGLLGRAAGAAGVVTGCGSLALCVLASRINRRVHTASIATELTRIVVVCPGCGEKQTLAAGDAACSVCKLRISIKIEEPRCPHCDYLLYRLTSDRCPECGTEVSAEPA